MGYGYNGTDLTTTNAPCECVTEPCYCDSMGNTYNTGVGSLKERIAREKALALGNNITVSITDWIKGHPYIAIGGAAILLWILMSMLKGRRR